MVLRQRARLTPGLRCCQRLGSIADACTIDWTCQTGSVHIDNNDGQGTDAVFVDGGASAVLSM